MELFWVHISFVTIVNEVEIEDKRAIRFERSSYLPEQVARVITNLIILTFQFSSYSPPNLSLGIKVNPFKRNSAYGEVIQMKSLKK